MTIAMPDITAELPKRELSWPYVLQMGSVETFPVLKEELVELTFGWHPLHIGFSSLRSLSSCCVPMRCVFEMPHAMTRRRTIIMTSWGHNYDCSHMVLSNDVILALCGRVMTVARGPTRALWGQV
jgi:hypothetical protein